MKWMQWMSRWFRGSTKSIESLGIGLRAAMGGSVPGGWASDHREETAHNTGFSYIAVHAIAAQVAGATVTVFSDGDQQQLRQSRRKSLAARVGSFAQWKSTYGIDDRETDPLPSTHPLIRLLKRPNPFESGACFRYRQAQQIRLTGTCLIWNVPSLSGPTCERYVIPTAMASPVPPTRDLPRGGWRISPIASRYTPTVDDGYLDSPSWYRILGQIVDARQIQVIRLPHAFYLDDGQSPLAAGAKWVDAGEAVDAARFHQLRNGIDPSVVWNLPPDVSPDQDEIDRVQAKISAKYGGPENVGRVMVAQSGTTITPLTTSPKDMCYTEGFHDFKAAVLALHQTPPVAVGLQEAGAYAAYNASMKAWRHAAVQPLCDMLAESDTEHLAPQFGVGLTVEIESDTVDDTELVETQLRNDLAAKVRTKNEWRAVRGMSPLPGSQGDDLVGTDGTQPAGTGQFTEPKPADEPSSSSNSKDGSDVPLPDIQAKTISQPRFKDPTRISSVPPNFGANRDRLKSSANRQTNIGDDHLRSGNTVEENEYRATLIAEILCGLYGDSVSLEDEFAGTKARPFDPDKHPRDELGRFTNTGTTEEIDEATRIISKILAGDRYAAGPSEVVSHLSVLRTSTLEALHKEHGVVPPPKIRGHLIRSMMARLSLFPDADSRAFPKNTRSDVVNVYVQNPELVNQVLPRPESDKERLILSPKDWGHLVGAQPGSRVYVFPTNRNRQVEIFIDHPFYRARRTLTSNRTMENVLMKVSPKQQKEGIATRALSEQVEQAAKQGFTSIKLWAAGNGKQIKYEEESRLPGVPRSAGFYTWARLGFDGSLESLMRSRKNSTSDELRLIAEDFDTHFPKVQSVAQLMKTDAGRKWWKKYGGEFMGTFDLNANSVSRKILKEYLAEKAIRCKQKSLASPSLEAKEGRFDAENNFEFSLHDASYDKNMPDIEHPDLLNSEEEEILDRIWDQIGIEMPSEDDAHEESLTLNSE